MKILSLSNFVPEQICDTVRFTHYAGDFNISHYCGYAADFVSQVISDDSVSGAVFPRTCDSTRIMSSYLEDCPKFTYQLSVPIRRDDAAVRYYADVIKEYQRAVEKHFGTLPDKVSERAELVNKRNAQICEIYNNMEAFAYHEYLSALHSELTKPLAQQKISTPAARTNNGKRAYIIGSFLANSQIARIIEESGFVIVGDNLPESGRLASQKAVSLTGDLYENIASSILRASPSPTQNDFREIIASDMQEIEGKNVQAIIFITQKFCEPYDYLYSVYKKALDEKGIPSLKLSFTDSEDSKKAELMLEAFADTL